jgi:aminoglycoside 2''-phosphotransferase
MTDDIHARVRQIERVFPHQMETLAVHDEGDDFLVIEVNHDWMFRFPRNQAARKALVCEKLFLPRFAAMSPLPVPQYSFVGDDFVGYRKIEGARLTRQLFDALEDETRDTLARQIGKFLSALHAFPLDEARAMGLEAGWGGWRERACARFRESVAPLLSESARKNALALFDEFFALRWKPVVIHGDFYPRDHLFFDETQRRLSGVIDFGDLTIDDAVTDFTSLLEDFGESFLRQVMGHYSGEIDAAFLYRIHLRIKTRPLFDAPYAIEYGFEERFRQSLSEIETMFGK